jgi:hypothetical protein
MLYLKDSILKAPDVYMAALDLILNIEEEERMGSSIG